MTDKTIIYPLFSCLDELGSVIVTFVISLLHLPHLKIYYCNHVICCHLRSNFEVQPKKNGHSGN